MRASPLSKSGAPELAPADRFTAAAPSVRWQAHEGPRDRLGPADEVGAEQGNFAVALRVSTDRAVVAVRGELDLLTSAAFGAFLDLAAKQPDCLVVVDLAELTFMDCAGLSQIARALARVRGRGGDIAIVSASPIAYKLFEITGFTEVIEVERRRTTTGPPGTTGSDDGLGEGSGELISKALAAELRRIVDLAATTVGRADGASMSLTVSDGLATVAASDDVIAGMDADQYSLREGPCVSAATVGEGFCIESMSSETRWPAFVARAYRRGINAVISTPLLVGGRSVGALNIYSRTPRAFALPQGESAWRLATEASAVLAGHYRDDPDAGPPRPGQQQ
jgi:anti-anti-sigma factor